MKIKDTLLIFGLFVMFIILGLLPKALKSQEVALFSQSIRSQEVMNPAYNADKDYLSALMLYRNQWQGIENAPRIMAVNIRYPVIFNKNKNFNGLGIAVNVVGEKLGLREVVDAGFSLDALIQIGKKNFMGVGINAGLEFYQYDRNRIISNEDPNVINNLTLEGVLPNLGIGILFIFDNYRLGLSSFTLVENELTDETKYLPGFDLFGKADYALGEKFELSPAILVKHYSGFSTVFDASITTTYLKKFGVGTGYRFNESVFAMANIRIANLFWINYTYDFPVGEISKMGNGSHEIGLLFGMNTHHDHKLGPRINKFE